MTDKKVVDAILVGGKPRTGFYWELINSGKPLGMSLLTYGTYRQAESAARDYCDAHGFERRGTAAD